MAGLQWLHNRYRKFKIYFGVISEDDEHLHERALWRSLLLLNGEEKFELWGKFLFTVQPIGEVNSADPAIGVDGDSQSFDIVGSISSPCEIGQVKLNLVPT